MNYQVLARKWRPKNFKDIVGQKYIITAIVNSFNLDKIHHAYILSGTRGIGKTTIARLFAKGLNCETKSTINMCGVCRNCIDIDEGKFIDLIEIDAATRTRVEDTYEFLDSVHYAPIQGRCKVYLIDEVHMLSRHSFNALLKILEEPPKHVKFILVTTDRNKIPDTVLSRCLNFHLQPLSIVEIISKLKYIFQEEKIEVSTDALELLACSANGSMRDALNLSEQALLLGNNTINNDIINSMLKFIPMEEPLNLVENLIDNNINNIMNKIEYYSTIDINWDHLFEKILIIFQKAAMYQFALNSLPQVTCVKKVNNFEEQRIYTLSKKIAPENIQMYYQIFLLGRKELPYSPNYRMGTEMTILRALVFDLDNLRINDNPHNHTNDMLSIQDTNISSISSIKDLENNLNTRNDTTNLSKVNLVSNIINDNIDLKSITKNDNDSVSVKDSIKFESDNASKDIISDNVTSKILKVRSKLSNYKHNNNQLTTNLANDHQSVLQRSIKKNVLERFRNIHTNIEHDLSNNIKKK